MITKLTQQERLELGIQLARTQTLVLRVFKSVLGDLTPETVEFMAGDIFRMMANSSQKVRFNLIEGTELCINLLAERHRAAATLRDAVRRIDALERSMHSVVMRSIEMTAEHDLHGTYDYDARSVAA